MSIEPGPITPAFMYLPVKGDKKLFPIILNASNVLGYLPGVGTIVGIARMIFFGMLLKDETHSWDKTFMKAFIFRGAIETCSVFGLALLIADVVNSIRFRHHVFA